MDSVHCLLGGFEKTLLVVVDEVIHLLDIL